MFPERRRPSLARGVTTLRRIGGRPSADGFRGADSAAGAQARRKRSHVYTTAPPYKEALAAVSRQC